MQGWRVDRPALARFEPFELWDWVLDGAPLYRWTGAERVEALRRAGLAERAIGEERRSSFGGRGIVIRAA